jgi:hypothetical protein
MELSALRCSAPKRQCCSRPTANRKADHDAARIDAHSVAPSEAMIHAGCRPIDGRTPRFEWADSCGQERPVKVFTDLDGAAPSVTIPLHVFADKP